MRTKIVVITGASRGIGRATGIKFSENGYQVYDLSRTGETDQYMKHINCDISDYKQVFDAVTSIVDEVGRIDIAISNAGFGISGSVESTPYENIKKQVEVNFLGASYFIKTVLPYIRESNGKILMLSSVAGEISIPFQALYSATKAAILSLAVSVDNELRTSGARAIALLPGDLSTNFTAARIKNRVEPDFYKKRVARSVTKMEKDELGGKSPDYVANRLYKLAHSKNPKVVNGLGFFYKTALVLVKLLPIRFSNWIIGKIYA